MTPSALVPPARVAARRLVAALAGLCAAVPIAHGAAAPARADAPACEAGVVEHMPGPPPAFEQLGITALPAGTDLPTGAGVTLAIVDSGVDGTHPQLVGALDAERSLSLVDDGEEALTDIEGHGTAVAGVISAQPSEEFGSHGIAPDAELISVRVYRASDDNTRKTGYGPEANTIASGIRAAVDAGADIIAVPLSHPHDDAALEDASLHAVSRGALVVASAGNRITASDPSDTPRYPAAYPGVLSVTAVDVDGQATHASIHGEHVDVAAPGQNVLTTANLAGDCLYATDAPSTSFATGYAAGVAALIAQAYPEEGPEEWAYRLMATADRPDPDSPNERTGWGSIRPLAALHLHPQVPPRGPINPVTGAAGTAIVRPQTEVATVAPAGVDRSTYLAICIIAGGLIVMFAAGTILRRRSPQQPQPPQAGPRDHDARGETS